VADPNTGVATYDTFQQPGWQVFGGTRRDQRQSRRYPMRRSISM